MTQHRVGLNKTAKRDEKIQVHQLLASELREWQQGFKVKIIPVNNGCLAGGIWQLRNDLDELFKGKVLTDVCTKCKGWC